MTSEVGTPLVAFLGTGRLLVRLMVNVVAAPTYGTRIMTGDQPVPAFALDATHVAPVAVPHL